MDPSDPFHQFLQQPAGAVFNPMFNAMLPNRASLMGYINGFGATLRAQQNQEIANMMASLGGVGSPFTGTTSAMPDTSSPIARQSMLGSATKAVAGPIWRGRWVRAASRAEAAAAVVVVAMAVVAAADGCARVPRQAAAAPGAASRWRRWWRQGQGRQGDSQRQRWLLYAWRHRPEYEDERQRQGGGTAYQNASGGKKKKR